MFQNGDLIAGRYELHTLLGKRGDGRQTWLACDRRQDFDSLSLVQSLWRLLTQLPLLSRWYPPTPYPQVVLKFLAFNAQMQWDEFKLFEREAEILQQQHHPRLPRYRDRFELTKEASPVGWDWYVLVQDYIPGASLQTLLDRKHRFTEAEIYEIATQVLAILSDLHSCDPPILHRDIKPGNLIWGSDRQIYLIDLGAVQAHSPLVGASMTVVGTSGYTPIEQFWGRSAPASDLYALGVTLIHLLTGIAPAHLPQQDLQLQFADRVKVNPRLLRWLKQMTAASLEKRFVSAQAALRSLQGELYLAPTRPPSDDWEMPSTRAIAPPKTTIQLTQSEKKLDITIPTGRMGLINPIRRDFTRLIHRQGIGKVVAKVGVMSMAGLGLGITSVAIGRWLLTFLTPEQLLLGYGSLLGLGLASYGLVQWGDRLHLRLDREGLDLERSVFGKVYFQAARRNYWNLHPSPIRSLSSDPQYGERSLFSRRSPQTRRSRMAQPTNSAMASVLGLIINFSGAIHRSTPYRRTKTLGSF
jgi:serine/threonine protein kinase